MNKISTVALIVAASVALTACNAETIAAAVNIIASELSPEEVAADDMDEMAQEDGGMKKFITETNGVDPKADPSDNGDKLVLTDYFANKIWGLVNISLNGMNEVISEEEDGPFKDCKAVGSENGRYTIKSCSGVVPDENGKDMTLQLEADVIQTKDASTDVVSTSGELFFGFYRGGDFYTIGVQELVWLQEKTATTLDEDISGDVLYVSRDKDVVYKGHVKIETPKALSAPDSAGAREFNAGYVKIKDVDNNSFDLTYFGNMDDPSISGG